MGWVPGEPPAGAESLHFLGYSRGIPLRGERLPLILQGKLADSTNAPLAARPAEAREATETRHFPVSAATHTSGARTIPGSYAAHHATSAKSSDESEAEACFGFERAIAR